MKKRKIGFVGAGSMGEALIKGLLDSRIVEPGDIYIYEKLKARSSLVKKRYRVRSATGARELAAACDILFLAVKPQDVEDVLSLIDPALDRSKILVSIAAGVTLSTIGGALLAPVRLVRAMPNTPALVGAGATALSFGKGVAAADRKFIMSIFRSVGIALEVAENLLDAVTGLSGSGPAYVFTFIQGLADGGVQAGLPRSVALDLAVQTVVGSARLVQETGEHPVSLRDKVASPGGTTICGIAVLEELGFKGALMDAVQAAADRSRELSKK